MEILQRHLHVVNKLIIIIQRLLSWASPAGINVILYHEEQFFAEFQGVLPQCGEVLHSHAAGAAFVVGAREVGLASAPARCVTLIATPGRMEWRSRCSRGAPHIVCDVGGEEAHAKVVVFNEGFRQARVEGVVDGEAKQIKIGAKHCL
jgi:hypothetical protein